MDNVIDTERNGQILRELRGDKSRREVAKDLGISETALMYYEQGLRTPRDKVKAAIANYYKRTIKYIFFNVKPTL
jgi:transcriptional regulator with XRE-family HTH domain